MSHLLLAAVLSLAVPVRAEEAKPAPAAVPPAESSPADMAKLRAVLQQLQAQGQHFDFVPPSDSPVVTGYARALPDKDAPANLEAARDARETGVPADRRRPVAGEKAQIRITDQLRDLGLDTGPVDVGFRGKTVVLSIKY